MAVCLSVFSAKYKFLAIGCVFFVSKWVWLGTCLSIHNDVDFAVYSVQEWFRGYVTEIIRHPRAVHEQLDSLECYTNN